MVIILSSFVIIPYRVISRICTRISNRRSAEHRPRTSPNNNLELSSNLDRSSAVEDNSSGGPAPSCTISQRVQDQLPVIYVSNESKKDYLLNEDSTCLICLNQMYYQNQQIELPSEADMYDVPDCHPQYDNAMDSDAVATSCDHVLHYGCLHKWLKTKPSCPACRNHQSIKQCSILKSLSNTILMEASDTRSSESYLNRDESFTSTANDEEIEIELDYVRWNAEGVVLDARALQNTSHQSRRSHSSADTSNRVVILM